MKSIRPVALLIALAIGAVSAAHAATVNISLNATPTILGSPNTGGTWMIVAKTDAPFGIAAISFWLNNINTSGLMLQPDVNSVANGGVPYNGTFGGVINLVYGQDTTSLPLAVGVGGPAFSDGPDPFGDPAWDGATKLISGTYSGALPAFSTIAGLITASNVLGSSQPGSQAQLAMTTAVVRVAVPEPAAFVTAAAAMFTLLAARRRP